MNRHTRKSFESDGRMDSASATKFLTAKGFLLGGKPNSLRLRGEATEMAVDLRDSFSPDFLRYFITCEALGEFDVCFSIIRHIYRLCNAPMTKTLRAFAANREVWREFLRITAEQVNLLLSPYSEGDPFSR